MEYCKLQLGCMVLVVYIALCHLRTHRRPGHRADLYDLILGLGMLELVFDALSAWTVNHLDIVPPVLNLAVHLVFLMLIDAVIFGAFLYIWLLMYGLPRRTWQRLALAAPFVVNELVLVCAIPTLTYQSGRISNYSDGVSATTCFVMALVYVLFALLLLIRSGRRLEERKRAMFMLYLVAVASVSLFQMLNRDALVSSLGTTILILGMYINLEDPLIEELESAHREMVVGYATLVERRDGSTGAHIKRTSRYVQLMADALVERRCYRDQLTRDVLRSLVMAAPHARHRQDLRAGHHPVQAGPPDEGGVRGHEAPHHQRRRDHPGNLLLRQQRGIRADGVRHRHVPPREVGWQRLSVGPEGAGDFAARPDHGDCRRVRRGVGGPLLSGRHAPGAVL